VHAGERNSVSRARSKRQSKDLMQWMEETAIAVENDRKTREEETNLARRIQGSAPRWKAGQAIGLLLPQRSPVCSRSRPLSSNLYAFGGSDELRSLDGPQRPASSRRNCQGRSSGLIRHLQSQDHIIFALSEEPIYDASSELFHHRSKRLKPVVRIAHQRVPRFGRVTYLGKEMRHNEPPRLLHNQLRPRTQWAWSAVLRVLRWICG
jgi:hypothetical protein